MKSQLSPMKTYCMKCQILFCGKNKKNAISLSSAELTLSVETTHSIFQYIHTIFRQKLKKRTMSEPEAGMVLYCSFSAVHRFKGPIFLKINILLSKIEPLRGIGTLGRLSAMF